MEREVRNLIHLKGAKIREVDSLPLKTEGENADLRIYEGDLYIKTKGQWLKLMSGDKIVNTEVIQNITEIVSEGVVQHSSLMEIGPDDHHSKDHTITSHSDTTATGANLTELTDGSESALHTHDGRYYTEAELNALFITGGAGITSTGNVGTGNQSISVDCAPISGLTFFEGELAIFTGSCLALDSATNALRIDIATDSGLETTIPTASGRLRVGAGDGLAISGSTTRVDLATFNPCLEFTSNRLDAKINTTDNNKKLLKGYTGVAIDESITPTWTGVHTHQALVKDKAKLQVSAGLTTVDVDLTEFPLQIAPNTNGEIFASYKGNQLEGFGLIGGSNESATYDTDYGVWS